LEALEANKDALIDRLILLISEQSQEAMSDVRSREMIRKAALDQMKMVLKDVAGIEAKRVPVGDGKVEEVKGVEALYFTDLVIQ
jgi:flagellar basal body-associated protein FliL